MIDSSAIKPRSLGVEEALYRAALREGYTGTMNDFWIFLNRPNPNQMTQSAFVGPAGPQGSPGAQGKDAYDPYAWKPFEEAMLDFSWKGINFQCPISRELHNTGAIPTGVLSENDVCFINFAHPDILKRLALFWRREYERKLDFELFLEKMND